jgi:hypothetical protein
VESSPDAHSSVVERIRLATRPSCDLALDAPVSGVIPRPRGTGGQGNRAGSRCWARANYYYLLVSYSRSRPPRSH